MHTMEDTTEQPAAAQERLDEPPGYLPAQQLWPATARGVRRARHALAATLAEWGVPELTDQACLVLSELMTNALRYGFVPDRSIGTSFLPAGPGVRLEVHDTRGEARPALAHPTDSDERGRGLTIVDSLTDHRWGVTERLGPGKIVWAVVAETS
jgi:anti-sigma regulatory factor (Ser/Thr protein kinase)